MTNKLQAIMREIGETRTYSSRDTDWKIRTIHIDIAKLEAIISKHLSTSKEEEPVQFKNIEDMTPTERAEWMYGKCDNVTKITVTPAKIEKLDKIYTEIKSGTGIQSVTYKVEGYPELSQKINQCIDTINTQQEQIGYLLSKDK